MKKESEASVEELTEEIVSVIKKSFVAIYEREGNSLIMRIPNGQKFRISVEEL